ncbi:MAG: hypothetical protein HQ515_09470 [Phycisphaeraceae bacterium]|nr:hypothetical protein [Phycisphaeraceae bacterium]
MTLPKIKKQLVTTYMLAQRWNMSTRNVMRVCRVHKIKAHKLTENGQNRYDRAAIQALEARVFI